MSSQQEVVVVTCGTDTVNKFDYNKLKDRGYKGEDYMVDVKLAKGPENDRKCTDCLFLIVWIAFLIGMMWMIIDGYVLGDAAYMLAPIASLPTPLVCGYDLTANYPYLYVPDLAAATSPITDYFQYGYCAESCPTGAD